MSKQTILVDWGGTIIRDEDLLRKIATKSKNFLHWDGPASWESVRFIGQENYFDSIEERFFMIGESYPEAIEAVSRLSADHDVFVMFDNRPRLNTKPQHIISQMAVSMKKRGGSVNGFYVGNDKLAMAKQINASVVIDDDPRVVKAISSAGIKSIGLLRTWNIMAYNLDAMELLTKDSVMTTIKENIRIAEDWVDAERIVKGL